MSATPRPHHESPYDTSDEQPPWLEEAADPTHWDMAFGSYGDGYLEWVTTRYYWDPADPRTIADTRTLWNQRALYVDDPFIAELNEQLGEPPPANPPAGPTPRRTTPSSPGTTIRGRPQ